MDPKWGNPAAASPPLAPGRVFECENCYTPSFMLIYSSGCKIRTTCLAESASEWTHRLVFYGVDAVGPGRGHHRSDWTAEVDNLSWKVVRRLFNTPDICQSCLSRMLFMERSKQISENSSFSVVSVPGKFVAIGNLCPMWLFIQNLSVSEPRLWLFFRKFTFSGLISLSLT